MKLEPGQVAVITGAASGIGRAIAEAAARRGLLVALADVEIEPLELVAKGLGAAAQVLTCPVDVSNPEQMNAMGVNVLEHFGRVDLLVNVAGVIGPRVPTWEQQAEDWQWILQVNLVGVANGLRAFVPHLVANNRGHIVNIASIAGIAPIPGGGNAPYAASKHAVVGLSETLRVELADVAPGVGVTIVCPGPVATRIREAERNRPDALRGDDKAAARRTPPTFELAAAPIDPENVAEQVMRAVEVNQLYLLPNPGTATAARDRVNRLLVDLPDH